ncbi:hypothetical protein QR98_0095670 [Sarcoptes scabiei]|uniref:Neurotransmitter-gated ion-channel ligand-binding domain-containing protein n=1 Tax=Sarcoptes scabiei TaxID=52283 RepID=A0A132AJ38_SARSC|nr:hypothetical protein QR98_0095670 [Sarcoptes scabiei]
MILIVFVVLFDLVFGHLQQSDRPIETNEAQQSFSRFMRSPLTTKKEIAKFDNLQSRIFKLYQNKYIFDDLINEEEEELFNKKDRNRFDRSARKDHLIKSDYVDNRLTNLYHSRHHHTRHRRLSSATIPGRRISKDSNLTDSLDIDLNSNRIGSKDLIDRSRRKKRVIKKESDLNLELNDDSTPSLAFLTPTNLHKSFAFFLLAHPVFIGLEIIDVDKINDAENVKRIKFDSLLSEYYFSLQLYLFELWHEPRLNTTALKQYWARNSDPIPVLDVNIVDCLWTPSLIFEDSTEKEHLLPPTNILLAHHNKVLLRKSRF